MIRIDTSPQTIDFMIRRLERRSIAPDLRCSGIVVTLDNDPVLNGVNHSVPAGSVTALVGGSGAGKSTLVKHILGRLRPNEGSVEVGGQEVWASTAEQLLETRRNLSALHSGPNGYEGSVFASLSARDNLLAVSYEKHANPSRASGGKGKGGGTSNPYLKLGPKEFRNRARYPSWLNSPTAMVCGGRGCRRSERGPHRDPRDTSLE